MLRRLVKARVATLLHLSAADTMLGSVSNARRVPTIFGYHRVVEDVRAYAEWAIPAIFTSRTMFEQHLDWITKCYQIVSLDELARRLEAGEPVDARMAAITFDDGYQDVYEHAFPVLRQRGLPAAVFVVTDVIGTDRVLLHDWLYLLLARGFRQWSTPWPALRRILASIDIPPPEGLAPDSRDPFVVMRALFTRLPQSELERLVARLKQDMEVEPRAASSFLTCTWTMLAEMSRGGIAVGSHTRTHALLTNESPSRVGDEIAGSKALIEEKLGQPASYFAYPDGRFDVGTVQAVATAGYRLGFTTCQHRDPEAPHLTLPRRLLWENACTEGRGQFSPMVMSCHVNGVFDLWTRCRQDHGWRTRRR